MIAGWIYIGSSDNDIWFPTFIGSTRTLVKNSQGNALIIIVIIIIIMIKLVL